MSGRCVPFRPQEMWDLPEFVALMNRLGIDREVSTTRLSIIVDFHDLAMCLVEHTYFIDKEMMEGGDASI